MGAVAYDIYASARRLETAFPLHTEEGVRDLLERLNALEELKFFSGDFDVVIMLADFYEALWNVGLSESEMKVIYYLYFEGYKQHELKNMFGVKANTLHTLLTRAIKKIANHYKYIKWMEEGGPSVSHKNS